MYLYLKNHAWPLVTWPVVRKNFHTPPYSATLFIPLFPFQIYFPKILKNVMKTQKFAQTNSWSCPKNGQLQNTSRDPLKKMYVSTYDNVEDLLPYGKILEFVQRLTTAVQHILCSLLHVVHHNCLKVMTELDNYVDCGRGRSMSFTYFIYYFNFNVNNLLKFI